VLVRDIPAQPDVSADVEDDSLVKQRKAEALENLCVDFDLAKAEFCGSDQQDAEADARPCSRTSVDAVVVDEIASKHDRVLRSVLRRSATPFSQ
jgi:hypothetical protein